MTPGELIGKEADMLRDEIEKLVTVFEESTGTRVIRIDVDHQSGEPYAEVVWELAP